MSTTPTATTRRLPAISAIRDIHSRMCVIGGNTADATKGLDAAIGLNPWLLSGQKRLLEEVISIKDKDYHLTKNDTDCIGCHFGQVAAGQHTIIELLKEQNRATVHNEYKALMLSWKRQARTAQSLCEELSLQVQAGISRERRLQSMLDAATASPDTESERSSDSDSEDGLSNMDLRPSKRARPSLPVDLCPLCHVGHSPTSPCHHSLPDSPVYSPTSPEP